METGLLLFDMEPESKPGTDVRKTANYSNLNIVDIVECFKKSRMYSICTYVVYQIVVVDSSGTVTLGQGL